MVCNCCGREIDEKVQDYVCIRKTWGFFSHKDGIRHEVTVCESCYDEWEQRFVLPAEVTEVSELL